MRQVITAATLDTTANTLTITPAALTGTISSQSKTYGTDDPSLSGITVTLGGVVNTSVTTWNSATPVAVDGTDVGVTLASLTRTAGETVVGGPYAITGGTLNALTGTAAGNYSSTGLLSILNSPVLTITPAVLGTIGNQTKIYGTDDPSLSGITVNLSGVVNTSVTTWNSATPVAVDGTDVGATLASLTRAAGETVVGGPYAITGGTLALTGSAAGNYSSALSILNSPILTITPAALTGTISSQSKTYGTDDPSLSGITVTLGGVVNTSVTTWNSATPVAVDGTDVGVTLASLTRAAGETVVGGPYAITGGTLNALTGGAASNYTASLDTTGNTLTITPASLTGTISSQSKTYGTDDPSLSGITVTLGGVVNTSVTTWNSATPVAVDGTDVGVTLASLTRTAGETVVGGPYAITGGTLNALTGGAASNYTASLDTTGNTLTITPASLTGTISSQSKTYGTDDPSLSGITVTLGGVVNTSVTTWNSATPVAVDGTDVGVTLASLTRTAGETVVGGPYAITGGTLMR